MPLISIIIPTYNYGQYIRRAIESVFVQTYQNYEIIIVDDGSTDNTKEILAAYSNKVQYVYKENGGLSSARNVGLSLARGSWIQFLDADDTIQPEKFEVQLNWLARHPEVKILASRTRFINAQGEFLSNQPAYHAKKIMLKDLIKGNPFAVHSLLIHRQCFNLNERFDESLRSCEDWDMWLRLADRYPFYTNNAVLANYHRCAHTMRQQSSRMCHQHFRVLRKVFSRRDIDPSIKQQRSAVYSLVWLKCASLFYSNHESRFGRASWINAIKSFPGLLTEIKVFEQFPNYFKGLGENSFQLTAESVITIYEEMILATDQLFKQTSSNKILLLRKTALANLNAYLSFQMFKKFRLKQAWLYFYEGLSSNGFVYCKNVVFLFLKMVKQRVIK